MIRFSSFILLLFCSYITYAQKEVRSELKKVYSTKELNAFEQKNGSLDVLVHAYDHGITKILNNGEKTTDQYPRCNASVKHFTELGVQIQPYTQYFTTENPGEILAVKSLYQLQLELNKDNTNKQ
jgi:hypothetical protein